MNNTTDPFKGIVSLVLEQAASRGDAQALVCGEQTISWRELGQRIEAVAGGLAALGVRKGDKAALLAPLTSEGAIAFLGILRAGACVVSLSTMASPDQLKRMLVDSECKVLFASKATRELVSGAQAYLQTLLPGGRIGLDFDEAGWGSFAALAGSQGRAEVVIDADDDFNLVYSSGTTSEPNGIIQNHAMRLGHAIRAKRFGYDPSSVTLLSTPLSSNITTVALFATMVHGGTVILMPKFDVRQYLVIAEAERVTHTTMVPVQYERILAHPEFDRYDLSSFKIMLSIGSQLRADVKRDIVARWPGQMFDFYSSTEGGVTCILPVNEHPDKLHTIGKPAPGNDVRMIDDGGRELPRGAIGEIVGHSPTMMRGYFKQPAKTAKISWRDADGNVFYKTGDVGRYDEDGFIVLHDRKKDMIISGGLNVYPADIENIVAKHPAVQDVAVIGVPSERWGEAPVAIVVRRPGAVAGADEIRDWANAQLGKPQRISVVEFRDELPRSNTGKVLKRQLRDIYVKTAAH